MWKRTKWIITVKIDVAQCLFGIAAIVALFV
jgi:hypothetical protein